MELIGDASPTGSWISDEEKLFKFRQLPGELTPSLDNPSERLIITFSIKANNSLAQRWEVHYDVGFGKRRVDEQCETMEIIFFLSRQRCESTRSENDCEIMFQGLISKARIKSFSLVFFLFLLSACKSF